MQDVFLDATSLLCPIPALKTKKAIDSMKPGQLLIVSAKDNAAKTDIVYLVQRLQLQLVDISEEDGIVRISIKK